MSIWLMSVMADIYAYRHIKPYSGIHRLHTAVYGKHTQPHTDTHTAIYSHMSYHIQPHIAIYRHMHMARRRYTAIYGHIQPHTVYTNTHSVCYIQTVHMSIYGCISAPCVHMSVYGYVWLYMVACGCIWLCVCLYVAVCVCI